MDYKVYKSSKIIRLAGWFLAFLCLVFFSAVYYAPLTIVEVKNPLVKMGRSFLQPASVPLAQQDFTSLSFESFDGLHLVANVYTVSHAKATIILLHGIRSNKEQWYPTALWLNAQGYNAVALDLRAHGQSEGRYCTFGYKEKKDVSALIHYLKQKGFAQPYGIWGHSLGGAIALQTMAYVPDIKFGIIESAYAGFSEIVHDYAHYYVPFVPDFLNDWWIKSAAEKAGFSPSKVSPLKAANSLKQPVLIVHGQADKKIKVNNALRLFEKIKSKEKGLLLIPKAGHNDIHRVGGKKFFQRIALFLAQQI